MSYVKNISDTSYDHSDTNYDCRIRDLYVDGSYYGPSIVGPTGPTGPTGATGATGATGPAGGSTTLFLPYAGNGTLNTFAGTGNPTQQFIFGDGVSLNIVRPDVTPPTLLSEPGTSTLAFFTMDDMDLVKFNSFFNISTTLSIPAAEQYNVFLTIYVSSVPDNTFTPVYTIPLYQQLGPFVVAVNTSVYFETILAPGTVVVPKNSRMFLSIYAQRTGTLSSVLNATVKYSGSFLWNI